MCSSDLEILQRDSPGLNIFMSNYFNDVLHESLHKYSLIHQSWVVSKNGGQYTFQNRHILPFKLQVEDLNDQLGGLIIGCDLPREADIRYSPEGNEMDCWILGKVVAKSSRVIDAISYLSLELRPMAILRD